MDKIAALKNLLQTIPDLPLAVLIGSQAKGTATPRSDWDIAVLWERQITALERLQSMETLKQNLADVIAIHKDKIDLIDMVSARLTMRAVIAEEGIVLKGEETLAWIHFLTKTWGELEDYYWRLAHAA
ncbi:MAG TPA: nucleotidyltransferase domain-containing protein [Burkholderiales bacterium]|nr:nucleotidyltransferase domain-containing protein [Burkholderiales bacterium]